MWTFNLQTFKDADVCLYIQSFKLVPVSGIYGHLRASCTSGYASVYFPV